MLSTIRNNWIIANAVAKNAFIAAIDMTVLSISGKIMQRNKNPIIILSNCFRFVKGFVNLTSPIFNNPEKQVVQKA